MTIHQLSVFIENKNGTLLKVLNVLRSANIQIIASTISDTVDYGIFRVICDSPAQAFRLLQQEGLSVTMSDVFTIELDNIPGQAARMFELFSQSEVSISYMYSFLFKGKGIIIFRTTDTEKTREIINLNKLPFISEENLHDTLL